MNSVEFLGLEGSLGVKERQERERVATSRAILDAARDLFVAEGYQNVSIRKIAEKIEYSPAAIYSYFPSKDDIFLALTEEGFRMLFASASADCAVSPVPNASRVECIRAAFWELYTFSKNHPEYFSLMFVDRSVPRISQDWQRFGFVREMRHRIADMIQQAIDAEDFPKSSNPDAIFRVLSAAIHGVAVMRLCDRIMPGEDMDALAHDTLEAALTGLRAGFAHTYTCHSCL
ncbi:MAG: TetR/AcrR family transcriptional regulator [Vicinamibacterales bacterium]